MTRETSGQQSSTSASVTIEPTSGFDQKIADLPARQQHRLAERRLGHVAQHEREHQRRERILELLEQVTDDAEHHHHVDVEHVVVDGVRADRADDDDDRRDDRERNAQDRRPPRHGRQHDDAGPRCCRGTCWRSGPRRIRASRRTAAARAAGPRSAGRRAARPPSASPGMPSVSIGSSALVPAACAAVSGAMTPSICAFAELRRRSSTCASPCRSS